MFGGISRQFGGPSTALRVIGQQVQAQALVMTYNDIFWIMGMGTFARAAPGPVHPPPAQGRRTRGDALMKILPLLPLVGLLAACTVGPDYAGPPATASDAAARGRFVRASDPVFTPTPGLARWWETLNDRR